MRAAERAQWVGGCAVKPMHAPSRHPVCHTLPSFVPMPHRSRWAREREREREREGGGVTFAFVLADLPCDPQPLQRGGHGVRVRVRVRGSPRPMRPRTFRHAAATDVCRCARAQPAVWALVWPLPVVVCVLVGAPVVGPLATKEDSAHKGSVEQGHGLIGMARDVASSSQSHSHSPTPAATRVHACPSPSASPCDVSCCQFAQATTSSYLELQVSPMYYNGHELKLPPSPVSWWLLLPGTRQAFARGAPSSHHSNPSTVPCAVVDRRLSGVLSKETLATKKRMS